MPNEQIVRNHVDGEREDSKDSLDISGQTVGVKNRQDVVIYEVALISPFSASYSQGFLQRREWTDPSAKLDENSPDRRRDMRIHELWPASEQESPEHHKGDKTKVQDDYKISRESIEHSLAIRNRQSAAKKDALQACGTYEILAIASRESIRLTERSSRTPKLLGGGDEPTAVSHAASLATHANNVFTTWSSVRCVRILDGFTPNTSLVCSAKIRGLR